MPPSIPKDVTKILEPSDLDIIAGQYDPVVLGSLFGLPVVQYPAIALYLKGIGDTVYPELDPHRSPNPLSAQNRERCLVALLGSRARHLELAIHLYMALANGIASAELAHILVLTGAYTGVDTVTSSLKVMQTALETLKDLAGKKTADPKTVLLAFSAAFPT